MYSTRITRLNPTAFIFLIDQSGSMEEKMQFGSSFVSKAEVVAKVTNMLIRELIHRCKKDEGVMDYFDIAAVGYSGEQATMLIGTKDAFVKPSTLAMANCKKRSFSTERILPTTGNMSISIEKLKYWIEPKAEGSTPMYSAMEQALQMVSRWCRKASNIRSYPPTIFNITDGEATDCDHEGLTEIAEQIKSLHTENGNALLININISRICEDTVIFPCNKDELPNCRYSEMLYDMSSQMPEAYNESILSIKSSGAQPPFRGMSLNTSASNIIAMMNIGSRSINKLL